MVKDIYLYLSIFFLLLLSIVVLSSISQNVFPFYVLLIVISIAAFWFFSQVGFEIVSLFSIHFYIVSIFLLLLTLVIGNVTRGTIRWIPLGPLNLQPAELVRPFLLVFFAKFLTEHKITLKRFLESILLLTLPTLLILIQPSLGVSLITLAGYFGVLIASQFNKRYLLLFLVSVLVLIPVFWQVLAPYQKQRILTFLNPGSDPLGAGYNSVQSVIAAGAGNFFGRGLGRGIQTQLSFLPAKQTDFVFSATGEELGFLGAGLMLLATFVILWRLSVYMENASSTAGRAYLSGFFVTYLLQVFIHAGMNLGILPVTGLPFPLVSSGGSSLLSTMIGLGIALGAVKRYNTRI